VAEDRAATARSTSSGPRPRPRPTFLDPALQEQFEVDGVVIVPLLSAAALQNLTEAVLPLVPADPVPMLSPHVGDDVDVRRALAAVAQTHLTPALASLLPDQEVFTGSVLVKSPGPGSEHALHQDWTVVDEDHFVSGVVWVPLVDTDERNGGLHAVLGSHRLRTPVRGSPDLGLSLGQSELSRQLHAEHLTPLVVPAGNAAVFDHRLLHGSPMNRSSAPRIAVSVAFHPRGADLFHYRTEGPRHLLRYRVRADFATELDLSSGPNGEYVLGVERVPAPPAPDEAALLDQLAAIGPSLRRAASADSGASPRRTRPTRRWRFGRAPLRRPFRSR